MDLDTRTALAYAEMAEAAYWPDNDSLQWLAANGWRNIRQFSIDHSQAYVASRDSTIAVVIRGSDELVDWIRNLKAVVRVPFPDVGRVHRGFFAAYETIAGRIEKQVVALQRITPHARIDICGHSLGAAIAVQMGFRLVGYGVRNVWLYGCPRIGNKRFASEYNFRLGDRTFNIRNRNDLVTISPFWNHAVGRQFYLAGKGKVLYRPGFFRRAAGQVAGAIRWYAAKVAGTAATVEFARDHFMSRYVEELRRARDAQETQS